jgi:RNA polymerase sigma factor (sigma-70 family)
MSDVTRILSAITAGDPSAAEQLLPLVYDELRKLAAAKLANEKPGQTLDATALVHEAYVRLVANPGREPGGEVTKGGGEPPLPSRPGFANRAHFFAAAAEAMRRILIENARRKRRIKHGGNKRRQALDARLAIADDRVDELLGIDEVLDELERHDAQAAALVKLRFFAGFEHQEAAEMLGLTRRAADRLWLLARTWLFRSLGDQVK